MSAETPTAVANAGPLAVVCGGGSLPIEVARAAQRQGRRVVLLALRGSADPQFRAAFPHHWVGLGQFGHACRHARAEGCRDIVMIGSLVRPHVRDIRLDFFTLRMLPRVVRAFQSGDDHLLSSIASDVRGAGLSRARRPRGCTGDSDAPRPFGQPPAERNRPARHPARACPASRDRAVRRWPGRDHFRQPRVGDRGRGRHGSDAGAAGRACAARAASRPGKEAACWSRRRSRRRTGGSTCRRWGRAPWKAWPVRVLPASLSRPAAPSWRSRTASPPLPIAPMSSSSASPPMGRLHDRQPVRRHQDIPGRRRGIRRSTRCGADARIAAAAGAGCPILRRGRSPHGGRRPLEPAFDRRFLDHGCFPNSAPRAGHDSGTCAGRCARCASSGPMRSSSSTARAIRCGWRPTPAAPIPR